MENTKGAKQVIRSLTWLALLWAGLLAGCTGTDAGKEAPAGAADTGAAFPGLPAQATYTYQVIPAADSSTFGYEILQNSKPFIRQQTRPALPGNQGFASRAQAARAAELVVKKLQAHQMPPSLTRQEVEAIEAEE